jgi:hypothetical protein
MRVRGVIRLSAVRSPRRITRLSMLRSSRSITPCSWPSLTSMWISSSVTCELSLRFTRNRRNRALTVALSSHTAGLAARDSQCIGRATIPASRSGASRASRFGSSSPSTMLR